MTWNPPAAVLVVLAFAASAVAQPQPTVRGGSSWAWSVERWVQQLENELDHLQEDLHYDRGDHPRDLREQVDQASRAVAHFHRALRRNPDPQHLMRDFEELDREIHELVDELGEGDGGWLRRHALRIRYADEQMHYVVRRQVPDDRRVPRDLLARHAHVLENEARNLGELVDRLNRRDARLRDAIEDFVEEAADFHETVEEGADVEDLREDFRDLDEEWHRVVDRINQSAYGIYFRRTAQNVNRVHNQIHSMLVAGPDFHERVEPGRRIDLQRRIEPRSDRPGIEFELPGGQRFRIPF